MTLEQCEKLKKWGLPQMVRSGTSFWNKHAGRPQWLAAGIADWEIDNEHNFAIPDLEQLLEFARAKCDMLIIRSFDSFWGVSDSDKLDTLRQDPDPRVAVYKLLEKVMEAES